MATFELDGYEVINGNATASGNGAHVHVPKRWRGASVKVVRTSEIEDDTIEKEIVLMRFTGGEDLVMEMSEAEIEREGISEDRILSESDLVMKRDHLPAAAKFALGREWAKNLPQPGMDDPTE